MHDPARVVLVVDDDFIAREQALIRRIEVGLMGVGTKITLVRPTRQHEQAADLNNPLVYYAGGSSLSRSLRTTSVIAALKEQLKDQLTPAASSETPQCLVHALGGSTWRDALMIAQELGCHLLLEIISKRDIRRARTLDATFRKALGEHLTLAWSCPDPLVASRLREIGVQAQLSLTSWGAHNDDIPHPDGDATLAFAILPGRRSPSSAISVLEALSTLTPDDLGGRPWLAFLDEASPRRSRAVGKSIRKLALQDRVSIVPSLEASRNLVQRCHLLCLPEPQGDQRSIVLDAMAAGVPLVGPPDPLITPLADAIGAATLPEHASDPLSTAKAWREAILHAVNERETLAEAGKSYIKTTRTGHDHLEALRAAYNSLIEPGSIPFAPTHTQGS